MGYHLRDIYGWCFRVAVTSDRTDVNTTAQQVSMVELYQQGKHEKDFFIEGCMWKGNKCDPASFHETITDLGVCHTFTADDMNVESSG